MIEDKLFLVNTNSKRIHDLKNIKGNCKLSSMREEYKVFYSTLEEALQHPSKEHPLAKPCRFCIGDFCR